MKIQLSFARLLQDMLSGTEHTRADFQGGSRRLLEKFIEDGVLEDRPAGTQRKKIYCPNRHNLNTYLHHKYEIPSLDHYITFLEKEETERSEAVKAASDSKIRNVRIFEGFLVHTFEEISGQLNGQEINLRPLQGSYIFINDFSHFTIPEDVVVVGVEGYENFRYIERQQYLFKGMKPLFLWRYQNSGSIAAWLNLISNSYLHFGDFDPKGIHIYISEFRNKISPERCRFLIPEDVEDLIFRHGEKRLFEDQMEYLRQVDWESYPEVSELMTIIKKLKKGLAQEVLIRSKLPE